MKRASSPGTRPSDESNRRDERIGPHVPAPSMALRAGLGRAGDSGRHRRLHRDRRTHEVDCRGRGRRRRRGRRLARSLAVEPGGGTPPSVYRSGFRRLFAIGALLLLVELVLAAAFIIDPTLARWEGRPWTPQRSNHSCVSSYWVACDRIRGAADSTPRTSTRCRRSTRRRLVWGARLAR